MAPSKRSPSSPRTATLGTRRGRGGKPRLTARTADKFDLYMRSVQAPETDSRFLARYFRKVAGRPAHRLREDFAGTAALACEFVKLHATNTALAVDLDGPTLEWGRQHNVARRLRAEQQTRVRLLRADVLSVQRPQVDILVAMNFSYFIFKTRPQLLRYLRNCRRSLVDDGMLFLDIWGGSATQEEQEERRQIDGGFTYVWDQHRFDPLTYHTECRIHFEFADGSRMRNAFVYDWRFWTPPELSELVQEAGFSEHHFLWEQTDRSNGQGNGVFRRVSKGDADPAWIAYLVARP